MASGTGRSVLMTLVRLALLGALLFVLCYLALFAYLFLREKTLPSVEGRNFDAMLVLGAQVLPDGSPSKQLELRLAQALGYYQRNPMPIVVSGAQGADEPVTEGAAMRDWFLDRGVPHTDILVEEASFNTVQNISEAMRLLPSGTDELLIVTSDYHLPRALTIARHLGLQAGGLGSPILPEYWLKNHAREALAWGKYLVNRYLPFLPF